MTEIEWTEEEQDIIDASHYDEEVFEAARECGIEFENVDEAYNGAGLTYDLYWDVYERNSIDGDSGRRRVCDQ